ncbi:MAG TPA: glycerol-3-phosphate 1-O-acyltransferase PlsY [Myxococcota bacterium]
MSTLFEHHTTELVVWTAIGFFAGSIPFGLLLALLVGKTDVRTAGSGNIGATNVARVVGKKLGLVTLVLDALKGAVPILIVTHLTPVSTDARLVALHGAVVGLAALLGHCFTPWLRFRGGKGVATGLGVLLALHPVVAGYGLVAFAILFAMTRMVSAASLAAAVIVIVALFVRGPVDEALVPMILCLVVIVVRHTDNIRRLYRRQENRL